MGRLNLQIKAQLENIAAIKAPAESDWHFKIKCTNCQHVNENVVYFNLVDKQEIQGSRGLATYIAKCKNCERTGNIDYIENSVAKYDNQNQEWATIATFECRGLEPEQFFPGQEFSALSSVSDTVYGTEGNKDPIDLSEGDWADYDEQADESVGIYEFHS